MSEWISVLDRMPDEGDYCATKVNETCAIPFVYYRNGEWISNMLCNSGTKIDVVTHWKHLPTPPEAKDE